MAVYSKVFVVAVDDVVVSSLIAPIVCVLVVGGRVVLVL